MMEFPLFPLFVHAAVQTLPVPRGWAGLGKSACLPITHLAALEGEQSTQTYGMLGPQMTKSVCSALLRFLLLAFLRQGQKLNMLGLSQMAGPFRYHWDCLPHFSVR